MRKPIIAANWKMYKTPAEARQYVAEFLPLVAGYEGVEIVLCPNYLAIETVAKALEGTDITVAAQDMHAEEEGAYTGEISAKMLVSIGVTHTILGHSERRHYNCETDWDVNRKMHAALRHGVQPIICVGEVLQERDEGRTHDVLTRQVKIAFEQIRPHEAGTIVVAYEPVWAIGTGQTASPAVAQEMHALIREVIADRLNPDVADAMRILYGGSVKPENACELLCQADIDGALVGGASLKPESLAKIIHYEEEA
jgi:triosephosphate isomerase